MPGMGTRCSPGMVPTARTSESKLARAGRATKAAASRTSASRLLIALLPLRALAHPRDAEVALQLAELVQIDRADQIDDGQLAPLGGEHQQADHVLAAHVGVDLRVLAVILDHHDALPAR